MDINQRRMLAMQRMAGNRAVAAAVEASVQRDACLVPLAGERSPYHDVNAQGNVGPGELFDANQRFKILEENFQNSVDKVKLKGKFDMQKSDLSDKAVVDPTSLRPHAAEIDHIVPKEKGGGNTERNAQVLGGDENMDKGTTFPWGKYTGARIYDPVKGSFDTRTAAKIGGADLTTLKAKYKQPYEELVKK